MERREAIDRDAKEGRSSSCVHFLRFRDAFDFYPSGRGERSRNDRAQRRWHARSVSDGSFPSNLDRGEKGKRKKLSRFPASRRLIAWNVANHVRTKETRSKRPRSTRGPFLTKNWNASQHIPRGCGSRPGT